MFGPRGMGVQRAAREYASQRPFLKHLVDILGRTFDSSVLGKRRRGEFEPDVMSTNRAAEIPTQLQK